MAGDPQIAGAEAAAQATRDWQAVHAATDIQFAPVPDLPPPKPPGWLEALGRFLRGIFEPVGKAIGMSWPVMQWVLAGLAALMVLYLLWQLLSPWLLQRRLRTEPAEEPDWAPDRGAAQALLEDADRLAREGRFDEAAHLLLRRSVDHIAAARPGWLHPASTAREIAGLLGLPASARVAFAEIATRVERSRFALRPLGEADWQAAREAYARFALERFDGAAAA